VSLATTTPEFVVSATASGVGDSGIALGNAVGSCICNIGLIVGTVAMIVPVSARARDFANRALWMSAGGALVVILSLDRTLSRPLGVLLLVLALVYLLWDYQGIRRMRAGREPDTRFS
jgi:cation:H+ antiporter